MSLFQDSQAFLEEGLNFRQREILAHDLEQAPLLVLAGAGTGKTATITRRLAQEALRDGSGEHVLALTFTRKAAAEMRERAGQLLSKLRAGFEAPWCGTFHALGLRILSESCEGRTGWDRLGRNAARLLSPEEADRSRANFWQERFRESPTRAWTQIELERLRCAWTEPDELERAQPAHPGLALWRAWNAWKERYATLDFEDLIGLAIRLLENDAELAARWRSRARTLLVDEYQDTNRSQYRLVRALLGSSSRLLAVGDDDQSIYGFRGADIGNVLDFRRDFPHASILKLVENYRSTGTVLGVANRIFPDKAADFRKNLECGRSEKGTRAAWWLALDEDEELAWIRAQAEEFLRQGMKPSQIALLTRANRQLEPLRRCLQGIPQAEASGEDGVQILTVHAAKGLEWPVVFHPFVDAARREKTKLLPAGEDEERRLFYVAVTRARDHLRLSSAARRRRRDDWERYEPLPWHRLVRPELSLLPGNWRRLRHFLSSGKLRLDPESAC